MPPDPMEQDDEELDTEEQEKDEDLPEDFNVPDDESESFNVPTETHKQRRANRFKEQIEKREAAESERDDLRRQLDEQRRQPPPNYAQPPGPPQPAADPFKDKMATARATRQQVYTAYQDRVTAAGETGLTKEEQDQWQNRAADADDAIAEVRLDKRDARRAVHDAGNASKVMVRSRHADVAGNQLAWNEANTRLQRAIAPRHLGGEGKPDDLDTLDTVMDEIREVYRMGQHRHGGQRVTEADKRRHAGVPRGGGAPPAEKKGYTMTALDRDMADIAFDHIEDDKERYRLYAEDLKNDTK